jgi:putative phage-type endonuclease
MKIINVEQGTDEWLKMRLGMITGTRLKSVMAGPQAQETLIYELVAEQLSGQQEQVWVNAAMQWGTDHEDEAVQLFEKGRRKKSEAVGFCISDEYPFLGLSPDRLTKTKDKFTKAIEVKCPTTKTALKYRYEGGIPKEYKWQVVNYFLVCETLRSLDFVVYDPRIINDDLKLFVVTVTRKDMQADIDAAVERIHSFREKWKEVYDKVRV